MKRQVDSGLSSIKKLGDQFSKGISTNVGTDTNEILKCVSPSRLMLQHVGLPWRWCEHILCIGRTAGRSIMNLKRF